MFSNKNREFLKWSAIIFWLVFTVVFALWWVALGLRHIEILAQLQPDQLDHWARQRRMIFWEGISWIVLLMIGGGLLLLLVRRERQRVLRIKEFFASFSHEIKTSLASLRLQAEALQDESPKSQILDRLVGDTVRLQLQLENSLFLASQDNLQLYLQPVPLNELIERMREQWPMLKIELDRACIVEADERAMRTIVSNLLQNAIVHGGATKVVVHAESLGDRQLSISLTDNGKGFSGTKKNLGQLFYRPRPSSGSGMGLYICRLLLKKMNGTFDLSEDVSGFQARMRLKGVLT